MIGLGSITTFSGIVAGLATYLLLRGSRGASYIMFLIMGTGGLAILWDRWSTRAGHRASIEAFLSPANPVSNDIWLLATHLPLFIFGLAGLILTLRSGQSRGADCDTPEM